MIAPNELPQEFASWNREMKAPWGPPWWHRVIRSRLGRWLGLPKNRMRAPRWLMRSVGPFAFQENSWSRVFEYPWCYTAAELDPDMRVVELGGGASGFQFALAGAGAEVISIDPLLTPPEVRDWTFSREDFERLNRAFGRKVHFIQDYLENAQLPAESIDRVFAISVIEHIPEEKIPSLAREIARILKAGGRFVATVDLFLDCVPFTDRSCNKYGCNISVSSLVEASGLELVYGRRDQLCGFGKFDRERVARDPGALLNVHGVLTQCFILQKP